MMQLPKTRSGRTWLALFSMVLGVELMVLGFGVFRLSSESKELERNNRRLSMLQHRDPFPSALNVGIARDNLDELEYLVSEFGAELKGDPFPQGAVEPAGFSAHAQDVVERFQLKAKRSGIQLPSANEAGFSAYASGGSVPRIQDVPRLFRQLYSVERVADVLVSGGVKRIDRLTRDLFEAKSEARSGRRHASRIEVGGRERTAPGVHPSGLCYVEKVGVTFTADEETVWQLLESFSSAPHFMAVTEFSHVSNTDILQFNPAVHASEHELAYLSGGVLTGEQALSRAERIIAGNELIQVDLMVEVYSFDSMEGM